MTREIKFRAWEKKSAVMRMWDYLRGIDYTRQFALFDDPDFVWMQYTGLKDKNGKEIYEGDVVENNDAKWEIIFHDACWRMKNSAGNPWHLLSKEEVHSEVIGNIYENPELIEKP